MKNKKGKGKVIRNTIILFFIVVGLCLVCIPLFKNLTFLPKNKAMKNN